MTKFTECIYRSATLWQNRLLLWVVCFFYVAVSAYGQASKKFIQDLEKAKTPGDSADCYAWASIETFSERLSDTTFMYARRAIALAKRSRDDAKLATAYFSMTYAQWGSAQNDSARHYAEQTLEAYDRAGKKGTYYTYALNVIAGYYLGKGDAEMALKWGQRQLETAIELKDTVSISNSYTMLGAIYDMMDNEEGSIKYAKKALELNEMVGNTFNRSTVLSNVALIYLKYNHPNDALPYLFKSIHFSRDIDSSNRNIATAYMLTGECYTQLDQPDSAFYYLQKANALVENAIAPDEKVKLWRLYSGACGALGRNEEAATYLDKAMNLAKETGMVKLYSLSADDRSKLAALAGDYQVAYNLLRENNAIEDSLSGEEVQKTIAELEEKYESDKKDARIAQQKRDNKALTTGIAIALLLTALILVQYVRQRRANRTIKKQSDKLTLLMKELHHRVKNNLQIVSSLLSLQSFRIKDSEASKAVREGQQRIEAMSLIHQRLYTRDNITEINIREFISDLVDSLQNAYGYGKDDIQVTLDIDNELMNVDQAIPLSLIINELVTNAFKYAYEDNNDPQLTVRLKRDKDDIKLEVADNGKGVNIEDWKGKDGSFGKELIQTFVKQLNGYLSLVVDRGTRFTLSIPYAN